MKRKNLSLWNSGSNNLKRRERIRLDIMSAKRNNAQVVKTNVDASCHAVGPVGQKQPIDQDSMEIDLYFNKIVEDEILRMMEDEANKDVEKINPIIQAEIEKMIEDENNRKVEQEETKALVQDEARIIVEEEMSKLEKKNDSHNIDSYTIASQETIETNRSLDVWDFFDAICVGVTDMLDPSTYVCDIREELVYRQEKAHLRSLGVIPPSKKALALKELIDNLD
eukprot:CAMPEP_0183703368 /NCGR_PEP_ID=MMETSP0737-20130205/1129_1 /TAXON_ID=385413 /ORGANISM="Thalassiosira miniscula, Strain CCMP1093" /LENGTH=223 /DNA_ID=CAMNT_0025930103 /DNA_START=394 /DNA_END=1068 /DNA_ORIENTATION=-